jgi:hypothetical protein
MFRLRSRRKDCQHRTIRGSGYCKKDKDTPESPAYAVEDIWLNAIAKFPDTRALADLLRTYSMPMPPGIRDLLAELLNPGDPDICGGRLVYKPTDAIRRIVGSEKEGDEGLLSLVYRYHDEVGRRRRAGKKDPSQGAAEAVGEKSGQSDRNVYRKVRFWRDFVARLRSLK